MNSSHGGQCSSSPLNDCEQRLQTAIAGVVSRIIFLVVLPLQRGEFRKANTAKNERVEVMSIGMEK